MFARTVKRAAGAFVAAITLSLVASIAPAAAAPAPTAPKSVKTVKVVIAKRDSGWG